MSQQNHQHYSPQKMQIQQPNNQPSQLPNNLNQQINQQANSQNDIQYQDLNEQQYQQYLQDVQNNAQRVINRNQELNDPNNPDEEENIQPVKNPVSAYMVFTMKWKNDNPTQKFSMSHLGQLWKSLQPHQKRQFQEQYRRQRQKYELYVNSKLMKNPNAEKQLDSQNKFFFPLYRIKNIMKQDKYYAPKTQSVAAMARATQYFGQYFLQELKKITQGKNRIDTKDLFECITVNQRIFGFLDCLIDDYALSSKQKKSLKLSNEPQQMKQKESPMKFNIQEKKKPIKSVNQAPITKPLPQGQKTLTAMFGFSNKK